MSNGLDLTERHREILDLLPASTPALAEHFGVEPTTIEYHRDQIQKRGVDLRYDRGQNQWEVVSGWPRADAGESADDPADPWTDTPVADDDPSAQDLSERERYIATQLQTGTTLSELADDIGVRESIVTQHLRDLRSDGWRIYRDETADVVTIEGDHALRSSEHKGTRTRKANRWWERRHNELVREFKALPTPSADVNTRSTAEDWVLAFSDVHAGDEVFTPDYTNVYSIDVVADIIDYITEKSLTLERYQGASHDHAKLLWHGDFVTNEGIYSGQFQDLDAWLDEQIDTLVAPLVRQIKAHAESFASVEVICQVGNHGKSRASGTSRQANADLILFKQIRNVIAHLRDETDDDALGNVNFVIGEARPYVNFTLRGGRLRGHLRHGQDRPPQATTRMGSDEWGTTLQNHGFDVCFIGHHHQTGRIVWDGPPVFVTGTPKPPSDFVDRIAAATSLDPRDRARDIAYCVSVADHGVTSEMPVKTHDFDYVAAADTR